MDVFKGYFHYVRTGYIMRENRNVMRFAREQAVKLLWLSIVREASRGEDGVAKPSITRRRLSVIASETMPVVATSIHYTQPKAQ
jgi:hypothetical protein